MGKKTGADSKQRWNSSPSHDYVLWPFHHNTDIYKNRNTTEYFIEQQFCKEVRAYHRESMGLVSDCHNKTNQKKFFGFLMLIKVMFILYYSLFNMK